MSGKKNEEEGDEDASGNEDGAKGKGKKNRGKDQPETAMDDENEIDDEEEVMYMQAMEERGPDEAAEADEGSDVHPDKSWVTDQPQPLKKRRVSGASGQRQASQPSQPHPVFAAANSQSTQARKRSASQCGGGVPSQLGSPQVGPVKEKPELTGPSAIVHQKQKQQKKSVSVTEEVHCKETYPGEPCPKPLWPVGVFVFVLTMTMFVCWLSGFCSCSRSRTAALVFLSFQVVAVA